MYENVLFQTDSNGDNELDKLKYKYSLIQRMLQKINMIKFHESYNQKIQLNI